MMSAFTYGPVPSRRLGQSLGVNNIPPKVCSYSCVYCQLGSTINLTIKEEAFYNPEDIVKEVAEKAPETQPDYVTFVPDGEPTLDENLGKEIKDIKKKVNSKIAVLTNASLIFRQEVQDRLSPADLVSLKVDAVTESVWKKINGPHKDLRLDHILEGIVNFSQSFSGKIITETMMISNFNAQGEMIKVGEFLTEIQPDKAYLAIPTRPPAQEVRGAPEEDIVRAYHSFKEKELEVEYLIGYEGSKFESTGDIEKDILNITSVHPMREDYAQKLIQKREENPKILDKLVKEEKLVVLEHENYKFYMRKLPTRK